MAPPTVLTNTYLDTNTKPNIDRVSKIFIISEIPFGVVRLPLMGNIHPIFILLSVLYSLGTSIYLVSFFNPSDVSGTVFHIALGSSTFQCIFLMIFNLGAIKRLQRYYKELAVFDKTVGLTPKIGKTTFRNVIFTLLLLVYITLIFILSYIIESFRELDIQYIVLTVGHTLEVQFIGHLLSLLIPRLRLINYYMELSLSKSKITRTTNAEEFGLLYETNRTLCKMENIFNLYHIIVKSYSYVIEAIKWQLLVILIESFINILCYAYYVSNSLIKDKSSITFVICGLGLSIANLLPLFAPCTIADEMHSEVLRLRELIGSRLYENELDKSSRSIARALLTWTEKKDLSFSLLRMLNIDVSLPFKFVGLLITYLIILLQFQKVINP